MVRTKLFFIYDALHLSFANFSLKNTHENQLKKDVADVFRNFCEKDVADLFRNFSEKRW